jgi:hypothetical protein
VKAFTLKLLGLAWLSTLALCAAAQQPTLSAYTRHDAGAGCSVFLPRYHKVGKVQWSGACIDGLASGAGSVEISNTVHVLTYRGFYKSGLPLGLLEVATSYNPEFVYHHLEYHYNQNMAMWGSLVKLDLVQLSVKRNPELAFTLHVPGSAKELEGPGAYLTVSDNSIYFKKLLCGSYNTHEAYCSGRSGQWLYGVELISFSGGRKVDVRLCPDPSTPVGCEALVREYAQRTLADLIGFVRATEPLVVSDQQEVMKQLATKK